MGFMFSNVFQCFPCCFFVVPQASSVIFWHSSTVCYSVEETSLNTQHVVPVPKTGCLEP